MTSEKEFNLYATAWTATIATRAYENLLNEKAHLCLSHAALNTWPDVHEALNNMNKARAQLLEAAVDYARLDICEECATLVEYLVNHEPPPTNMPDVRKGFPRTFALIEASNAIREHARGAFKETSPKKLAQPAQEEGEQQAKGYLNDVEMYEKIKECLPKPGRVYLNGQQIKEITGSMMTPDLNGIFLYYNWDVNNFPERRDWYVKRAGKGWFLHMRSVQQRQD